MPSDQIRLTEQAKFMYSPLAKAFEIQIKTIEDQGIKQVESLRVLKLEENQELESIEGLFPKKIRNNEIKNEIDGIKKLEEKINREHLNYETKQYTYDFQQYEKIRSFGDSIYTG